MPAEDASRQPHEGNYKQKYKLLKRKLKFLVYEQECFMEELRRTQRKVLKVARDRSFLLDRLGQYERGEDSSDESDGTTSGSELDAIGAKKRSRIQPPSANQAQGLPQSQENLLHNEASQISEPSRKKAKMAPKKSDPIPGSKPRLTTRTEPVLSREEVERQLDSKPDQPYMQIGRAPLNMPSDIFNNDSSNADSELNEASLNLVMDMDKEDLSVD